MGTTETETGINKVVLNFGTEHDAIAALDMNSDIKIARRKYAKVTRDGCRIIITGGLTDEKLSKTVGVVNLGWLFNHPNFESAE
jgi:hypothetical protein